MKRFCVDMSQAIDTKSLMAEKKKIGIYVPVEIESAYRWLVEPLKHNEKWVVATAAILGLLAMNDSERIELYSKVKGADLPGRSLEPMIENLKHKTKPSSPTTSSDNIGPQLPVVRSSDIRNMRRPAKN